MRIKIKKTFVWRAILPIILILIWLSASAVGGPYFGKIDEVSSNDMSTFLPDSAESTRVNAELAKFRSSKIIPAIIVFESNQSLTQQQQMQIEKSMTTLQKNKTVKGDISPIIISEDKKAAFITVPIDSNSDFIEVIPEMQTSLASANLPVTYKFTGPAVFAQDLNKAFAGIDGVLILVALSVVFLILLVVYRSPILPVVTLLGAMFALSSAILVVWHLAKAGYIELNGQVQGILFILVIGAATDYALLYIARYREELIRHRDTWIATKAAWKSSWEPIIAAGGTVTLGLLCLLVSDLGSNKALGPVGGIGIIFAILSALTFLPAALLILGRKAFWPRHLEWTTAKKANIVATYPTWSKVGRLVSRHPRRIWTSLTFLLLIACLFIPQFKADGVAQNDFVLGKSEAREGQNILDKHFPGGSGSPAYVLVPSEDSEKIINILDADKSVSSVSVKIIDSDKEAAPVGTSKIELRESIRREVSEKRIILLQDIRKKIKNSLASAPESVVDRAYNRAITTVPSVDELVDKADPFADTIPMIVNGNILLYATFNESADSLKARDTIKRLRSSTQTVNSSVSFGGVSAVQLDTNVASQHDLMTIIPLILFVITIILMLLLRAIVAPLLLLFTTVLSFGATLGVSALLFNNILGYPGADPSVVIYGFVFLVALGIDYNIFLVTRVREETIKSSVRKGTIKGLVVTGGVISSAGIVLASTFAALYVIPILFLAQIAFIVAFGVLLDTLVIRSLLVPSLTLEIGRWMWWPSRLFRKK